MDYRTLHGKKFNECSGTDEKMLFLLESIYDKLDDQYRIKSKLEEIQSLLRLIAEVNIREIELQNKSSVWKDDYIKELHRRLRYL